MDQSAVFEIIEVQILEIRLSKVSVHKHIDARLQLFITGGYRMCTCKRCFTKRTGLNVKDIIAEIEARKQQKSTTASSQALVTDGNTDTGAPDVTNASATD